MKIFVANVLLKKLGIEKEMAPKSHVILGRKFVGEALADGEVELGLQQLVELRLTPGVTVVGPLPKELQKASIVSAAVSSKAKDIQIAKSFLDFLSSPTTIKALKESGLEIPQTR